MADDGTTADLRTALNEALNNWKQGLHDQAIEALREHADSGSLPAVVATCWFYAQRSQGAQAAPYVRTALDVGIAYPGIWFFPNYSTVAEYVPLALDIARTAAEGGQTTDQVQYWQPLWDNGYADAAVSLFEIAGSPQPHGLRGEWERLVSDARSGNQEIQTAAAVVEKSREDALTGIAEAEDSLRAESERVSGLVDETTSLVHGVTADQIAKAYAKRSTDTLNASRLWTFAAIIVGLGAAAWAGFVAVHAFTEDEGLATTIGKTLVSVPLFIVAGYLANVAGSNRRMAWHWSHIELQIRTAEPFIGLLDEETRKSLLAALAVRFFPGQGQDPQSPSASSENLDIGTLVASVLGKPAASAAPSSPPQRPAPSPDSVE